MLCEAEDVGTKLDAADMHEPLFLGHNKESWSLRELDVTESSASKNVPDTLLTYQYLCFVDRSYMRLTEKEDETLPIDVSWMVAAG